MRKFLLFLVLVCTTYYGFKQQVDDISSNKYLSFAIDRTSSLANSFFYQKRISINGTHYISDDSVKKSLPISKSNLWWHLNKKAIERELLKNPLVVTASVKSGIAENDLVKIGGTETTLASDNKESCWFGCFQIDIKERKAQYAAFMEGQPWLIGDDGNFIRPIPVDFEENEGSSKDEMLREFFRSKGLDVVILSGIVDPTMSPDIANARVKYLNDIVPVVESELRKKIAQLNLHKNGELIMKFDDITFPASFNFGGSDKQDSYKQGIDMSVIGKEAKRLNTILEKFKGKEGLIKSVDLAYDKLAVIKLNQ